MNNDLCNHSTARRLLSLVLVAQLALATPLQAASVVLATAPLVNSTTSTVLPNLMFLMDNSGSMSQEYTPDWVSEYNMRNDPWNYNGEWNSPAANEKNCRDSADDEGTIETAINKMDMCVIGDVPFTASAINSQYYNPEIRYLPGANADGSSKPSQTGPTLVLLDGYNKHNKNQLGTAGTTIDLTTTYPDRVWCTTNTPAGGDITGATALSANCRTNTAYLYPDGTYKYGRDTGGGTTANKNVLGKSGAPYYYSPVVTEYCKETELRDCTTSSVATGLYTFPAKARYCSDVALTTCQSIKTSTYIYPRYPGTALTATAASGSITLTNTASTTGKSVSSILVGAVEILGAAVSGDATTTSATLAQNIALQINVAHSSPEFTASAAGDVITITSTAAAGATANGIITYTDAGTAIASKVNTASGVTGGGGLVLPYTFARTDIVPATPNYPKTSGRIDCVNTADATIPTTVCTYDQEITNFGNWYAYYRTRMQSMKSSVSNAFTPIGSNYRVGFMNICKGDYLPVAGFDNATLAGGTAATGSFRVHNTSPWTISSVTVNGIEILGAPVTGTSRANLATRVASQINVFASTPEYTAAVFSSGGSATYVRITASATGTASNGTIVATGNAASGTFVHVAGGTNGVGQKTYWYDKLFNTTASGCGTPLRSALATVGRIYAGKELSVAGSLSGATIDPMQYACQKNFTLLTTDGYWNSDSAADIKDLLGAAMVNTDASPAPRPLYEGPTASSGSLADVAKYYYETDLRTSTLSNCTGSLGIGVCEESASTSTTQRMTTYALGLGVDGTLSYVTDYDHTTSGDFYNLKNGLASTNWPVPAADTERAVDDLWHAAVNGRGTYFSAKDPAQLATGLNSALAAISATVGAASAAATSTLNPVAGNNYAYVASYTTAAWKGNLEARSINVTTGVVNETASWCIESIPAGDCAPPKSIVAGISGSSTIYNCVTPSTTLVLCPTPGVFDGVAGTCAVEMTNSCTGTMPSKVASATDTRTIYKSDGAGALQSFVYANVNAADFNATKVAGLSQWSVLSAPQKTAATGANLVNYLRGQTGYEDRSSNTADDRLYRFREATLGDALESQPFFISKPVFSYADPGYTDYKTAQAARAGTVFMGTNDGMMHAFAADTGIERWAFVPSAVIPDLWKLADKNYATQHHNYVNGSPVISDICTANCACDTACVSGGGPAPVWKTILVGGLNAGGRSYYALDITDPATPSLLWEISSSDADFANLGFSYGQPIITKKADVAGTWVVVVTSGYNNTAPGDGKGYLFVLNALNGAKISAYDTGVGDTTTPSGLAKVAAWNDFQGTDNTAGYLYGGDLKGNLWRFNINTSDTVAPVLFATLKDSLGNSQPVTAAPTLGEILSQRVVFVGTGKYLETTDLTDTSQQTIYAIRDDNTGATLVNARTVLVAQTLSMASAAATSRSGSNNPVAFSSGRGWYVDLASIIAPATTASFIGERVNIDMQLVQGTLIVATIVPSNTVCSPGGYGWLNYFNYETGGYVGPLTTVSQLYSSPIVGINVLYIEGKPIVEVVTASKPTPEIDPNVQISNSSSGFSAKRVIWRELVP